jgi:hypothetical protein
LSKEFLEKYREQLTKPFYIEVDAETKEVISLTPKDKDNNNNPYNFDKDTCHQTIDYLQKIIDEQKHYDSKVLTNMSIKYPSATARLFMSCYNLQQETAEVMKVLKPVSSYWRDDSIIFDFSLLPDLDNFTLEQIEIELIDCMKFLVSALDKVRDMQTNNEKLDSEIFYGLWRYKHNIIEQRLKDEGLI